MISTEVMPKDSTREQIMASTMSVDEYFDELIDFVVVDRILPAKMNKG